MVLTQEEYHLILPKDPFTRPPNPGVLVPNPNGTAAQIASAENNHRLTKYLFRDSSSWENLHPANHRSHRHQISHRPSQPRHRTNHTTRPNHPWVPSQQLRTYHHPATLRQNHHHQNNAFWPRANHRYHLQLYWWPCGIRHSIIGRINPEKNNQPCPCYPKQITGLQRWHASVETHKPSIQNVGQI